MAIRKIQESVTHYSSYNLVNAKLAYIKAWQALPEYGLTHFLVKFRGARREVSCKHTQAHYLRHVLKRQRLNVTI